MPTSDSHNNVYPIETATPSCGNCGLRACCFGTRLNSGEVAGLTAIARGVGDPDSDWLRILAYQELGRLPGEPGAAKS